ncbi:MAG: GAF domain-containing protein [Anaerolineae bacterium]
MATAMRSPVTADWRQITNLGEKLASENSLIAQRDRIISVTSQLIEGRVEVWLQENMFRLPDWEEERIFPPQPPLEGMRCAIQSERTCVFPRGRRKADGRAFVAVPLEDQGLILGVIQVTRDAGPRFSREEVNLLEGLAHIVAVGLLASHRLEVERFRLRQLNLVRQVSAQVANVMDVDELARRVTDLIQKTFHFYYVAIFTLEPGSQSLKFRSSASAPRKGRKKASIALEVEVGEGLIGAAAARGEQILCPDVRSEPRFRFVDSLPETRSEIVLPLKVEDRLLGVLDVQSNRLNAFHPNDVLILSTLADNIARAIEGARLYHDLHRRAEQLTLIAEVSKSVTSSLDLRQLMRQTADLIHERFGYPYVHLFTVHPNRRLIEYQAGSGKRSAKLEGYTLSLDDEQGIIPWVARHGQTILANDVNADPRYRPSPLPPRNTRAELCVPLQYDHRVVGILDIQSDQPNAFTEDDRLMFEAVGGTIAAAIRNADLYQSEQWRRQVADSLREVAGLVSANVGVEQVLDTVLHELERNLLVDVAAIWLLGEEGLYLAAVHGANPRKIEQARLESAEASISLISAMLADSPVIRKPGDPIGPSGLAAGFPENYSSLAAPLRIGDRPLGVIVLSHHTSGRYGHEAQAMATTFASYAAVAIENARLYDTAQEQAYASAALLQVAQAVVSLSDLDEILGTIVRIMPILVGVERVVLYLWDEERQLYVPRHHYGVGQEEASLWQQEFPAGAFPMLDAARQHNRLILHPLKRRARPRSWPRLRPLLETETPPDGDRLLMALPVSIRNDLYGILLVEEADGGRRFRARRIEIISGIAQQIGLAIQNDRLQREMVLRERLETEVQLARQIQQTFIPQTLPQYPAWQLAARWQTARQVGGDFYDVFELPDRRLGLFIADVADKGVPAALFMALTRTLVRAAVIETASPAQALQRVNELLIPDTHQGMFVSAVYAVVDLETGTLTYANAGHNPPLWIRQGRVERLMRTAMVLGVTTEVPITERTIQLQPGDCVLFYTDGLTEAFSAENEMFGEARLIQTVASASATTAEDLLDAIENRLLEFLGLSSISDDLTMLVIRYLPE